MDVVPDVVVLGKPMGNGHPIGYAVTGRDILSEFRNGFRYFNTFGGNPVSCAAAMAVLEEIEQENLVENARVVGDYARGRLRELAKKHAVIGDVRGSGLIFGAELVQDRNTMEPAGEYADRVVNGMRQRGVLHLALGKDGCTLKIRPPMPFSKDNADLLVDMLDEVLSVTPPTPTHS